MYLVNLKNEPKHASYHREETTPFTQQKGRKFETVSDLNHQTVSWGFDKVGKIINEKRKGEIIEKTNLASVWPGADRPKYDLSDASAKVHNGVPYLDECLHPRRASKGAVSSRRIDWDL